MPYQKITAEEVHEGDLIDLEGDPYADQERDKPCLQYEYAKVLEVRRETEDCVCVYFDNLTVGFPIRHELWRVVE